MESPGLPPVDYERAKTTGDHVVLTESALGDEEVAIAFRPREEWPKVFRFYPLFRWAAIGSVPGLEA